MSDLCQPVYLKEMYGYDASAFIEHIFCDSRTPKAKVWTE